MSIGAVGITTNPKKEASGAPFTSGSAENGLSVEGGKIVLGNPVLSNSAILTNDRVIPMDGNTLTFEGVPFTVFVQIGEQTIQLQTGSSNVTIDEAGISVIRSTASAAQLSLGDPTDIVTYSMNGNGVLVWNGATFGQFGSFDMATGKWQVGFNPGGVFNGARLEVVGSLTADHFVNTTGGAIALSEINDKGKLFTNSSGASTFSLPAAGAGLVGVYFMFCVTNASNLVIQAGLSDSINIAGTAGGLNGSATANTVGYFVKLVCLGNLWVAESVTGTWVVV